MNFKKGSLITVLIIAIPAAYRANKVMHQNDLPYPEEGDTLIFGKPATCAKSENEALDFEVAVDSSDSKAINDIEDRSYTLSQTDSARVLESGASIKLKTLKGSNLGATCWMRVLDASAPSVTILKLPKPHN